MSAEIVSHVVWGVAWVAMAFGGLWAAIGLGVMIGGTRIAAVLSHDLDAVTKRSRHSFMIVMLGWLVGAIWFLFAIVKAVIQAVAIFV